MPLAVVAETVMLKGACPVRTVFTVTDVPAQLRLGLGLVSVAVGAVHGA